MANRPHSTRAPPTLATPRPPNNRQDDPPSTSPKGQPNPARRRSARRCEFEDAAGVELTPANLTMVRPLDRRRANRRRGSGKESATSRASASPNSSTVIDDPRCPANGLRWSSGPSPGALQVLGGGLRRLRRRRVGHTLRRRGRRTRGQQRSRSRCPPRSGRS